MKENRPQPDLAQIPLTGQHLGLVDTHLGLEGTCQLGTQVQSRCSSARILQVSKIQLPLLNNIVSLRLKWAIMRKRMLKKNQLWQAE